jgi:magnesium-transporting ATPase (P-type)
MCQQKLTKQQYDQKMLGYEEKRRMRIVDTEDLNGFPLNSYCFIGMFSLLDPPRVEVPESVLKARRAQIRVAMVTGDHPTTAKSIAKQVNIFTSEIAEMNGIDTFKIEQNESGQSLLRLYRNETLLEEHIPGKLTPFTSGSKAARAMIKQIQVDDNKSELIKEGQWYKQCCSWCRNQFSESKSTLKKATKKEHIPYAIVVGF